MTHTTEALRVVSGPSTNLRRYRWLLVELVIRDLRLRYRGTYVGFLWTLLNPVVYMAIYTFVFGFMLNVGIHRYPAYLLAGLVPWTWFLTAVTQGVSAIQDGRMYVGKTVFPTEALVVVPVLSNMINFVLSLPLLLIVDAIFRVHIGWSLLCLPLIVAIQFVLTYGVLLLLSTYNVFYRDIQQLISLFLTFVFFVNPIFYTLSQVPQVLHPYLLADPITPIIMAYQDIFFYGTWPSALTLAYAALFSIVIYFVGKLVFDRHIDAFPEYL
ncbi:MAG: ABC transporter permease [Candidatus Eremiobacteraeota bacterium]|nr:ABC transporter permease [Candidatus Eremiobacteraeota bacterium]